MTTETEKLAGDLMAAAKKLAMKEFGEDYVAGHPEMVVTIFQGLTAIEQAKAMDQLGDLIGRAVGEWLSSK